LAPIVLLKCLAVVSCKLQRPRLSVLHISPTRGFKSYSSFEVMKIFDQKFWLDLKSDFTMNSLFAYKEEIAQSKALFVNDATTLFASKGERTKDRLVGGLSELISDGSYIYQDYGHKYSLEGNVTVLMNITSESFQNYKNKLFGQLTFLERVLQVHYVPSKMEKTDWIEKQDKTKDFHYDRIIQEKDIETNVKIPSKYFPVIRHISQEFSYESLNSIVGCQDIVNATLRAHSALNKRKETCVDDIRFVASIKKYLKNPFSPYEGQIVRLRAEGLSVPEICRKIGKTQSYRQQAERFIEKAQLRGILESESPPNGLTARRLKRNGEKHG
jgi:hypothetical protein